MLNYIYTFVFVAAFALPVVVFAVICLKWPRVGLVSLAIYFLSYLPLTLSGAYTVANHGGNDWRREWLPKFLMVESTAPSGRTTSDITLAGALYWPCILIDHLVWHRTATAEV